MSFVNLTCPSCEKRVLLDAIDDKGFCMYCGQPIDLAETQYTCVDPMSEEILKVIVNDDLEFDNSDEPWYEDIEESMELLQSYDFQGAADAFTKAVEGKDEDTEVDMKKAMMMSTARCIMEGVFTDNPYMGGVLPLARAFDMDEEGSGAAAFVYSMLDTMASNDEPLEDGGAAYNLILSAYHLLIDAVGVSDSIDLQLYFLDLFLDCVEAHPDADAGDGRVLPEQMASAVSCIANPIDSLTENIDEEGLYELEQKWKGKDVGRTAADILARVFDDGFVDCSETWDGMEAEARAYVESYIHS